ncbi:MAG: type II toxin-antitoxin system mRNA interferase toxin, RelE/StbE family [Nitrospirae bacterium]|nr:type II toxin-antitoxin system mRNA interferase toxin, RelE/StbE family [Nitrospirota bacterium]MBF0539954.1 type II toxin-antitoxin system mRNA interferase toxin, RelE/StbE family [Nitrospirota bacterium]
MNIKIEKSFDKDIDKIDNKKILLNLKDVITKIKNVKNQFGLSDIKKITGYQSYYRIRIGDYRLGVEIIDEEIILLRFLHRKDIYKFFPIK